ncbi:MAG: hypothetical protein Kow0063_24530 [Anaerolineae bacterium]
MEFGSFCGGTLIGGVYGGVIVYLIWQMEKIRIKMREAERAYDTFPDSKQPSLTAYGVTRSSRQAGFTYTVLFLFLILFSVSYPLGIYLLLAE